MSDKQLLESFLVGNDGNNINLLNSPIARSSNDNDSFESDLDRKIAKAMSATTFHLDDFNNNFNDNSNNSNSSSTKNINSSSSSSSSSPNKSKHAFNVSKD